MIGAPPGRFLASRLRAPNLRNYMQPWFATGSRCFPMAKVAIGIGYFGLFVTGVIAATAVYAMHSALTDGRSGGERSNIDEVIE
jgi:hypothetical protein